MNCFVLKLLHRTNLSTSVLLSLRIYHHSPTLSSIYSSSLRSPASPINHPQRATATLSLLYSRLASCAPWSSCRDRPYHALRNGQLFNMFFLSGPLCLTYIRFLIYYYCSGLAVYFRFYRRTIYGRLYNSCFFFAYCMD